MTNTNKMPNQNGFRYLGYSAYRIGLSWYCLTPQEINWHRYIGNTKTAAMHIIRDLASGKDWIGINDKPY